MHQHSSEKGQALIIITLAAVILFGFTALAIDGSMVFSDKRHAQNAADTSALAGALAYSRNNHADDDDDDGGMNVIRTAAWDRATSNGYDNGPTNDVSITATDVPADECPAGTGLDITVTILSYVDTTFARVIGRDQVTNQVSATTRVCGRYNGPPFKGNAIVSLARSGVGYDAHGTPVWFITGGGIFSNSGSNPAAICGGDAGVNVPSITSVGTTDFSCHTVNISPGTTTTGATQLAYSNYSSLLPRQPACNGTATPSGGQWHPQAGADGSRVAFDADMDFAPGLYCVTNSPGPYQGTISGSEVTFYMMSGSFSMKFDGGGNLTATAPTSGEYKGILMYLAPQVDANGNLLNTQAIDLRGNGSSDIIGTIIAPSADVTMFGNSGTTAINSQVIGYQVDTGGTADITVAYQANDNYQVDIPMTLTLLR